MRFLRRLFRNKTKEKLAELSKSLEGFSAHRSKLQKEVDSLKDGMWKFQREVNGNVDVTGHYEVDNVQVVTNRQAHIPDVSGGVTHIDVQSRATIALILAALETHGLLASS